jgi:23S rRNA pseudouridine2605 synthase
VPRVYLVTVRGRVTSEGIARLVDGVQSGKDRLRARAATIRKVSNRESLLIIELVEGRNREIRRMMSAIDHDVMRLRRVQFGAVTIAGLAPGEWRVLTAAELQRAFPGAPLSR